MVGGDTGENTDDDTACLIQARAVALLDRGTTGHTVTGRGREGGNPTVDTHREKKKLSCFFVNVSILRYIT